MGVRSDDLPAAGARRRRHLLRSGGCRLADSGPAGGMSVSAHRASGCRAPRSAWPRCSCRGNCCFDRCGAAADPYMTLVGYFNATRELAGMARYMADDVQNRVAKRPPRTPGFPSRARAPHSGAQRRRADLAYRVCKEIGRTWTGSAWSSTRLRHH
jgi:hypothetical protein